MSNKNEPAYPTQEVRDLDGNGILAPSYGLTKRELIAAMAMQGLSSNSRIYEKAEELGESNQSYYKELSSSSVKIADALLEALK